MNELESSKIKDIIASVMQNNQKESIHIKLLDEIPSLFDSKFGGIPYIPKDTGCPTNQEGEQLKLLAQINLSELKENGILPDKGILQFFIYPDDLYGVDFDNPTKQDGFKVVYYDDIDTSVTLSDVEPKIINYNIDGYNYLFPLTGQCKLDFKYGYEPISIGDYSFESKFIEEYNANFPDARINDLYDDLGDDVFNIIDKEKGTTDCGHKIGGYPFFTQQDPRSCMDYDEFDTLLLQIDTDSAKEFEIMWGDSGVCNFFINSEDLKNLDFSNVLYNWDCC